LPFQKKCVPLSYFSFTCTAVRVTLGEVVEDWRASKGMHGDLRRGGVRYVDTWALLCVG
jgi:hypothetical protein